MRRMAPEAHQKEIQAAMIRMGNHLVAIGYAKSFTMDEPRGIGEIELNHAGRVLRALLQEVFETQNVLPPEFAIIDTFALTQLLLISKPR